MLSWCSVAQVDRSSCGLVMALAAMGYGFEAVQELAWGAQIVQRVDGVLWFRACPLVSGA